MSESPTPGWYADPSGHAAIRWWDGFAWTSHTQNAQPAPPAPHVPAPAPPAPNLPSPMQVSYGQPAMGTATQTAPFRPAPAQVSTWERNKYAFITVGIVVAYALLAWKAHVYVLGILPVMMSVRSKTRNEPLSTVAIIAGAIAVLVAVIGITHH